MLRKLSGYIFILIIWLFVFPSKASAITDPANVANNKVGIHITDEHDLENAAQLTNSSGGDWGYVTFVVQESERNQERWQKAFDKMRSLHLIPIVRVATKSNSDGTWEKPKPEEINNWIAFLNSLNWVTKNRYVIIYNEPNHSKEWGGEVNPKEYAKILSEFSQKLKVANEDFFVLPAGLDASSPNSKETMDEELFLKKMKEENSDIFSSIDGWTSHSYPNPDFSGSEKDTGRGSIKTFEWELSFLKSLGLNRPLAVFITETGWKHGQDSLKAKGVDPVEVGKKFEYAFENAWNSDKIIAVTPFILNYKTAPFSDFSWTKPDGNNYEFFGIVQKLKKVSGKPEQITKGGILAVFASPIHRGGTVFNGAVLARNYGQSIWEPNGIIVSDINNNISILGSEFYTPVEPSKYAILTFKALTPINNGFYNVKFALNLENKTISNEFAFEVISAGTNKMQSESLFDRIGRYLVSLLTVLSSK